MKNLLKYLAILFIALATLSSCQKDDPEPDPYPSELVKGCYIVNYGNWGSGAASISKYDYETDELTNLFYQNQNPGLEFLSNIQFAYQSDDQIFLLGDEPDQLITINPLFEQSINGVTDQINNPRTCIANGDYLYISCWGTLVNYYAADSYIAKYNIESGVVESTIALEGGAEDLEIVNGKLYAALNYINSIAVIDLETEAISYIETPITTSYFLKDPAGNLYVSLVSYSPSESAGIGYINTTTDELESLYPLAGISPDYCSIFDANADFTKIYVTTATYDANWNLSGSVKVFDVTTKTFAEEPLVSNISGPHGLNVNPVDGNIYVYTAESVVDAGQMTIYTPDGELVDQKNVGIYPSMAIFQN